MSVRTIVASTTGGSKPIVLATNFNPVNISYAVLLGVSATGGSFNVEFSHDDPTTPVAGWTWFTAVSGTGSSCPLNGSITYPIGAIRINVLSLPTGGTNTFTLIVRQAGQP